MKAIVNEGCIGCGLCASTCPAVFTLEDGVAVAMAGDIPEEELPAAAEARDGCPVSVIDIQADVPPQAAAAAPKTALRRFDGLQCGFCLSAAGRSCPFGAKCAETAAVAASPPVSAPPVRVHTAAHIHCSSFSRSSLLYVSGSSRRGP